jgi:hypothetical protein
MHLLAKPQNEVSFISQTRPYEARPVFSICRGCPTSKTQFREQGLHPPYSPACSHQEEQPANCKKDAVIQPQIILKIKFLTKSRMRLGGGGGQDGHHMCKKGRSCSPWCSWLFSWSFSP